MQVLYDTGTIHPLDRYDYYRASVNTEIAPVVVHGRPPGHLATAMSVAQIGEFEIETHIWSADSEIVARRTERLIRTHDPECYRISLSVTGKIRGEQAGNQVEFRARDIGLYDSSHPWQAIHPTGKSQNRMVMLTFPRTLVPIAGAEVRPLIGTLIPRNMPGRSLIAQFLIELTGTADLTADPDLAHVLYECTVGLIHQRLDRPSGITRHTRQLLYMAHIHSIISRNLNNPRLDPNWIAKATNISPRHLHQLFQGTGVTPMQLVKRLRLQECNRILQESRQAMTPIKDIIIKHGYVRPDQFARDFKKQFGVSATQVRRLHSPRSAGCEG